MSEPSSKEIAIVPREEITIDSITPEQITHQMSLIKQVMEQNMEKGHDYGVIPGTKGNKPTLLKPGAEKLCKLFFLAPTYAEKETDLGNGHKDCSYICSITQIHTGRVWGEGIGSCSTMESKYRYRKDFSGKGRVENPDIADQWNTVRKMGKKRAFVDAILTVTAASAIFTQDVGDDDDAAKVEDKATGETAQTTREISAPDAEGISIWRGTISKIVPTAGTNKKGQPWHRTALLLPGENGDYWVSTFDVNLGKRAAAFEGKIADLTVKPGLREGSWELVNISFPGISRQVETAVRLEREKEANGEQELELEEAEANPFNDQD